MCRNLLFLIDEGLNELWKDEKKIKYKAFSCIQSRIFIFLDIILRMFNQFPFLIYNEFQILSLCQILIKSLDFLSFHSVFKQKFLSKHLKNSK